MGNFLSGEGKLSRRQREELIRETNHRRIVWIDEQFGYRHNFSAGQRKQRHQNKRKISLQYKNRKSVYLKTKSHSLDAIVEELYWSGAEDTDTPEGEEELTFQPKQAFIPRIKLTRSVSSLKEEKRYKSLFQMSSEPNYMSVEDSTDSFQNTCGRDVDDVDYGLSVKNPKIYLNEDSEELSKKPDENYFAKNFDECMKRLQLIEKEHELMEKDETDVDLYFLQRNPEKEERKTSDPRLSPPEEEDGVKPEKSDPEDDKNNSEFHGSPNSTATESIQTDDFPTENDSEKEGTSTWYSSLKQQFEKNDVDNNEQRNKEMSCRITGATLKNSADAQKSEDKDKETRHYFSRLVKSNKSLIDEELPDPDKVKHIRAMFQENLDSTLKRRLDRNLGGSLQNISTRATEQWVTRPLSAQCNRNDLMGEMGESQRKENKPSEGEDPAKDGNKEFHIENAKRKLFEKCEKDLKIGRDFRSRKLLQPKWTDTGSVSSGVSSDLSSFDTDLESYSREEKERDEITVSDDDLMEEVKDKHYVQNEILEKIRSFGTSVTYYGGEMITCSVGPLLSPTTQAIMEEIGEKYAEEKNATRTFEEFYRKYVETNEPAKKKKVGRTRSFGQSDVFQKPNVLSNTEIEMYKNDLEIEIGIKKPTGIPRNGLKMKIAKSASLGSQVEKAEETFSNGSKDVRPAEEPGEEVPTETSADAKVGDADDETPPKKPIEDRGEELAQAPKEIPFGRSKSAPEGFLGTEPAPAPDAEPPSRLPPKQILFGYEKSLLNGKRPSDMEFEEFEVCESLAEKLEKLQEKNPDRNSFDAKEIPERKEEKQRIPGDDSEGNPNDRRTPTADAEGSNRTEKKHSKHNHSRWPIETTVMVDIQKNNEQTPKIVTNGKTSVKTKIRLF